MNRTSDWLPFVKLWSAVLKSGGRVGPADPEEFDAVWEDVEDLKLEHVQAGARELRRLNVDGFVPTGGRLRQLAERARLDDVDKKTNAFALPPVKPEPMTEEQAAEVRAYVKSLALKTSLDS